MTKTIAIGIAILTAVNIVGWVIVANQGRSPFDDENLLVGSRAFSVPRRDVQRAIREDNAVPVDVEKILTSAQQFKLLSIDPDLSEEEKSRLGADALFHGFRILGKAEIHDPVDRASLARALVAG